MNRGPTQADQISEPTQGGKASLKFSMICGAEEEKLGDGKEESFQKFIRSHKGGVNKPFKNPIACHNYRVDTTKTTRTTETSSLISTFLYSLALLKFQLNPHCQGRVGHAPETVAEVMACEVEVRHVPEVGGRNFGQDPEGGTASVAHEGDPSNLRYIAFDPGGISKINLSPTGGQFS